MLKKIVITLLFATLSLAQVTYAQVFSLDLPTSPLHSGFNNQLGINLNFQSGNTDLWDTNWSFRSDYVTSINRTSLELNYDFGQQNDTLYSDNGVALIRYIQPLNQRFEFEAVFCTQYDYILNVSNRTLTGGGIRYAIVGTQDDQSGNNNLTYGLGVLQESETWIIGNYTQILRLVNYVSWLWNISPTVVFNTTARSFLGIAESTDHRADFVGKLSVQLTSQLAMNTELDLKFDSQPAPGVYKGDLQLIHGLTWSF